MSTHKSSLDGLLSGLGGVEGSILNSKRRSMASVGGQNRAGRQQMDGNNAPEVDQVEQRAEDDDMFSPGYLDVEQLLIGTTAANVQSEERNLRSDREDLSVRSASGEAGGDIDDEFLMGIYGEGERAADPVPVENIEADVYADGLVVGEFGTTSVPRAEATDANDEKNDIKHFARYQYQSENWHDEFDDTGVVNGSMGCSSPTGLSPRRSPKSRSPTSPGSLKHPRSPKSPKSPDQLHHQHTTMADVSHKAAKGLQTAKNWLFSASKTLARDVQSRIEAHKEKYRKDSCGGGLAYGHRRRPSIIDSPPSDFVPEEHHQIWARQLVHAPPETQAAALDAMEDYDRLAVQQVIDEMIWYETKRQERAGSLHGSLEAATPNTTSNEDLIRPARRSPPPPPAPSPPTENFDLLDLSDVVGEVPVTDTSIGESPIRFPPSSGFVIQRPTTEHAGSSQSAQPSHPAEASPNRAQLKAERLAREQKRVEEKVASARDQASRDASEKEEKVAIRERLRPEIDAWASNKKDNIRSLLCTMDTVLWNGSSWKSPSVVDIMEPGQVRKWYMKANLVVHPDKVKQSHGSLEQLTRAEMIFDVLKYAWGKFN